MLIALWTIAERRWCVREPGGGQKTMKPADSVANPAANPAADPAGQQEERFADFESLRAEIARRQPALPRRLGQLASYALDNPDQITFGTVASISAATNVPPSTIVRFAQSFGFNGFLGLQQLFRQRLGARSSKYINRMTQDFNDRAREQGLQRLPRREAWPLVSGDGPPDDDRAADLLEGFFSAARQSLDRVAHSVPVAAFREAADILAAADTIYLIAERRCFAIASCMAYAFGMLRVRFQIAGTQMGLDNDSLAFARPGDAVFAVCFFPYAADTVRQARVVAGRSVPLVSMTDSAFSPLVEISRTWLEVAESDCAGFRLLSAGMALAMALPVAVADRRGS
jgi:DNA-binding MurR/RpiR family transcriptional regulator